MRRMRYLEAGDAIRGWGVLLVVIGHSGTTVLLYTLLKMDPATIQAAKDTQDLGFQRLFDSRQVGAAILATQLVVFLFFALSAYLLARPFIAAMFGEAKRPPRLKTYVKHRAGRVIPLFWAALLIYVVYFHEDASREKLSDMLAMFAFGQSWTNAPFREHISQAWTMNVEMLFYIALPIVAAASAWIYLRGGRFAGWRALLPMVAVGIFAWVFSNTWLPTGPGGTVPSQSPIGGLLTFVPGVLIAVAEVRWGERIGRWKWAPPAAILLVLVGIGLAIKQSSLVAGGSVGERNIITLAAGAMLGGFVLWQLTGRKTWPFMMWKFPRWVGERSFSIYLMHGLVLFELHSVGETQPTVGRYFLLLVAAAIPCCIFFGAILYALVEQPATRLARGERPLFGDGPVRRLDKAAPTVGTTPTAAMATAVPLTGMGAAPPAPSPGVAASPPGGGGATATAGDAPPPTTGGTTSEDGGAADPGPSTSRAVADPPATRDRPGPKPERFRSTPERPAWRRPWLGGDGARGLGALLVFVSHIATAEMTYKTAGFQHLPGRDLYDLFGGEVGWRTFFAPARLVNLFFAFSAYLLARPFIAWALGRAKRPGTAKFYVRRVLRIMPLYVVVVGLVVLWLVVLSDDHPARLRDIGKTLLLLDGGFTDAGFHDSWAIPIETAWTVRVEVLGYLMLPLVAWGWFAATRRWGFRGLVGGVGLLLVITLGIRLYSNPGHAGPGLLQWLFLPGLTVAVVESYDPLRRWISERGRGATLWALLASFLLLCGSEPASASLITHLVDAKGLVPLAANATPAEIAARGQEVIGPLRWGAVLAIPMQFVGATGMLLCFIALEWQGGRPPLGLDRKIPRWFGERSYSFYLVHFAVLGLLLPHVAPGNTGYPGLLALGVCAFALSLALTVVSFKFVEMPGMLLASRLTGRRPPGPLSVAPTPEVTQAWRGELAADRAGPTGGGADDPTPATVDPPPEAQDVRTTQEDEGRRPGGG